MLRTLAVVLLCLFPAAAHADKRVALVIGNSAYRHAAVLANPKNDATDLAVALKSLGFQVVEGFDLDKSAFDRKVRDFATVLQGAEVGLFFFAGHGLQVSGQNYLAPVDAELKSAAALDFEMVRVDVVHRAMEHQTNTNILFLDACRDNPMARNLARAMGTRSAEIGRGFAPVASGLGTLISFSTQPGNVALDGTGRNSPFAGALARHIASSADDLSRILIHVRNDVGKETQGRQVPWDHSALTAPFYFKAPNQAASTAAKPAPPLQPQLNEAERAWGLAKDATDVAVLEAFVARYKDSFHADLARARIAHLKNQQLAVAAKPAPRPDAGPRSGNADPILAATGTSKRFNVEMGKSVELTSQGIVLSVRDPDLQKNSVGVRIAGRGSRWGAGQEFPLAPYKGGTCRLALLEVRAEAADFLLRC